MKTLSLVALLIGTMVGAGFATGREILSFFGSNIPLYVAPLCGVLIFGGSILFLLVGKKARASGLSELNSRVLGKAHIAADIFLLFNALVVLSGMLAAMDSLMSMVLPIAPAYSVLSGILCALIVMRGTGGLIKGNLIIVPLVIVSIVTVCCFSLSGAVFPSQLRWLTIPSALVYVSMNMMLACSVFTSVRDLSTRQIIVGSAIGSALIAALLALIIAVLNSQTSHGTLPILEVAQGQSTALFWVALISVAACIFTTMLVAMSGLYQWLSPLMGEGKYAAATVLLAGLIVSNMGFENVIRYLYPVIGVLGLIYSALCLYFLIKRKNQVPQLPEPTPKNLLAVQNKVVQKLQN